MTTTTTTNTRRPNHARNNAIVHAETIIALHNAYVRLDDGDATEVAIDGFVFESSDHVTDYVQEYPSCVEARSGWNTPGADPTPLEEFRIGLAIGDPTLWVRGALDTAGDPSPTAYLEYADQSKPPTRFVPDTADGIDSEVLHAALQWFVGCFDFGN